MKIISLQAENIKKLKAVEIKPNGEIVTIAGKNGQGKTSILDSIWWALAGIGAMAKESDYQIWVERVDSSGKVGIVIEDGAVVAVNEETP